MSKFLGIIFSLFVIFADSYSAQQFTVVNTKNFPTKQDIMKSVMDAQSEFVKKLAEQQGSMQYFIKSNSVKKIEQISELKIEFKDNEIKASLVWNKDISLSLNIPDKLDQDKLEEYICNVVSKVFSSRDYSIYSSRRIVDSMTIKVEKNSYTVFLSNGESDEGTVFSLDV